MAEGIGGKKSARRPAKTGMDAKMQNGRKMAASLEQNGHIGERKERVDGKDKLKFYIRERSKTEKENMI